MSLRTQVMFILVVQSYRHADHIMFKLGLAPGECIKVLRQDLADKCNNMELCRPVRARDVTDKKYMFVTELQGYYKFYLGWRKKQAPYIEGDLDNNKESELLKAVYEHRICNKEHA